MDNSTATPKPYRYACERCQKGKMKCTTSSVEAVGKCSRCLMASADCIFDPFAPRQRRARTDARVKSLEKELQKMTSTLESLQGAQSATSSRHPPILSDTPAVYHDGPPAADEALLIPDVVSYDVSVELLQNFSDVLLPQYPVLEVTASFDALRQSKPILLLAMIMAASSANEPKLFEALHSRLVRQITDMAITKEERSVELVQSILILVSWYHPPEDHRNLNIYQWTHIASTMALQLGLGRKTDQQNLDLSG